MFFFDFKELVDGSKRSYVLCKNEKSIFKSKRDILAQFSKNHNIGFIDYRSNDIIAEERFLNKPLKIFNDHPDFQSSDILTHLAKSINTFQRVKK